MKRKLHILPDTDALATEAAAHWRERAQTAITLRGRFSTALSGGTTPAHLYRLLAADPQGIDWERVWVYFGDERCVSQDHADSNYRMANETLLSHVPIPTKKIFRMACEVDPARAAESYAASLSPFQSAAGRPPVLDLILLGLGTDGHTASLFPGSAVLNDETHWVAAVPKQPPDHPRLTLTFPVLNAARELMFMVSGANKANVVREVLRGKTDLPAAMLRPAGEEHWFLDAESGSGIDR